MTRTELVPLITALHRFHVVAGLVAPPGALAAADRALALRIERRLDADME
ncbi:hypothetical protein [Pseudonocardia nigra]|nr:hypothetical protein [Pseudonocardia nigra]